MIDVFLITLVIYIIYYFVSISRYDKYGRLKNKKNPKMTDYDGLPAEVKYFISKYNVDLDKVNLRGVLKLSGVVLGLDIALLAIIVLLIFKDEVVIEIIVASIFIIPVYMISMSFAGRYFKKKGLVKDVQSKRNRKKVG
jgi:hypothetical protein